jgi:hypothetical protein
MFEWFLDWQLKIVLTLGVICVAIVFVSDFRGVQALIFFLISLILIFGGNKIYAAETSENWLKFSYTEIIKNIFAGALMLIGWMIFLRRVLALAIASLILKGI